MDIESQLKIMEKAWGRGRAGYVFLPWIPGDCKDKAERRKNYHESSGFYWPNSREKILAHMERHINDDLYWCPSPFEKNRRLEPYAVPEICLWADLDEAHPEEIDNYYRPTIAWETSPGRFQGIWLLNNEVIGLSWAGRENHRLTAYLGADPSGWDTTQLLRVPGWHNHKPEYRKKYNGPVPGKVLWKNGPRYTLDMFKDLPEVQTLSVDEAVMDEEIEAVDRHEVWSKIRLKVSKPVRQFMTAREATGDRSEVLWQIERELADAGCTLSEVVAIVRGTVWNKYRGRNDELKRLRIEAAKAIQVRDDKHDDSDALEEIHEAKPDLELLTGDTWGTEPRPRWLVDEIWREGVCGFIAGDPKNYKSWVALDLAISIASGEPFLGVYRIKRPGPVIFIEEEDRQGELEDRASAIFNARSPHYHHDGYFIKQGKGLVWAPPTPLPLYKVISKKFLASDPGWQAWLADQVRATGAVMVIIDTLGTTAGDTDIDRGSEVLNEILSPLKDISHDNQCAIAVVHHNRKSGEATGGRRMLGSHHLFGWTEDSLFFGPPQGNKVVIERSSKAASQNKITMEVPHMHNLDRGGAFWAPVIDPEAGGDDDAGVTESKDKPKSKGRNKAEGREEVAPVIVGRMIAAGFKPGEFVTANDVAERTKQKANTTYVQLDRATKKGWLEKVERDGHLVWRLPVE